MHARASSLPLAAGLTALVFTGASADVLVRVDKAAQIMTVTVDGAQRYAWPVSTGMADYDTPAGDFQAFRMERDHFSREWDDAPMPYSIFFTQEGHAIHGSYDVKHLGRPASHGCVRLAKANAAVLFALVKEQGLKNTKVVLTGEIPDAVVARRDPGPIYTEEDTSARPQRARASRGPPRYYDRERTFFPLRRYYGGFPFGW
ncbi:MAG TPA: L,D-transpeptidase [Pseudolabrys sp.]|nr:L,D-transpeptidase [Pseudolabrys sp.]